MEIITLQEYTDQYVSLYEGEIRNLPNDLALRLINKGVAAQHDKDILNSTTSDDNGKVLTVVNGKPTFSAPATVNGGNSTANYIVYYAIYDNSIDADLIYKNTYFTNDDLLTLEQFIQDYQNKDFIIINGYTAYDQYEKISTSLVDCYSILSGAPTTVYALSSFGSARYYIGSSSTTNSDDNGKK